MTLYPCILHAFSDTLDAEKENRVICVNRSREKPFTCLITDVYSEHVMTGGFGSAGQYFPFYTSTMKMARTAAKTSLIGH